MRSDDAKPSPDRGFEYEVAQYRSHGPEFAGNLLVMALRRFPVSRARLQDTLDYEPRWTQRMRMRSAQSRRLKLSTLARFFIASPRVCELAEFIYSQVIQGYVGRRPRTAEANRLMQEMYLQGPRASRARIAADKEADMEQILQRVSVMTGIGGSGKTLSTRRVVQCLFPPIIFHPKLNIWQIPVLLIQMPFHGKQGVSLAVAIIEAIDALYPDGGYFDLYLNRRAPEPTVMANARRLLHIHCVGLIVADDAQHTGPQPLDNYDGAVFELPPRPKTPVTWMAGLLFDASKTVKVPLLLLATSDLEAHMSKTWSMLRLKHANGLRHWDPLDHEIVNGKPSEYDFVMNRLWACTLLREHPAYNIDLRNAFLFYTAAIPDVIVKLYFVLQWHALQEGKETFSVADVGHCARTYMKKLCGLAIKIGKLVDKDVQAEKELFTMPDLRHEFGLRMTAQGPTQEVQPSLAREMAQAVQTPAPNQPRAQGRSTPQPARKTIHKKARKPGGKRPPLRVVPTASASQIGEEP